MLRARVRVAIWGLRGAGGSHNAFAGVGDLVIHMAPIVAVGILNGRVSIQASCLRHSQDVCVCVWVCVVCVVCPCVKRMPSLIRLVAPRQTVEAGPNCTGAQTAACRIEAQTLSIERPRMKVKGPIMVYQL